MNFLYTRCESLLTLFGNFSIKPLLRDFHWLPVCARCIYKIAVLAYKFVDGSLPKYLSDLLTVKHTPRNLYHLLRNFLLDQDVHWKILEKGHSISKLLKFGMIFLHLSETFKKHLKPDLFVSNICDISIYMIQELNQIFHDCIHQCAMSFHNIVQNCAIQELIIIINYNYCYYPPYHWHHQQGENVIRHQHRHHLDGREPSAYCLSLDWLIKQHRQIHSLPHHSLCHAFCVLSK